MAKKKKKPPITPLPPLAAFWQAHREKIGMTFGEIAQKTDIPDATLSRWFAGEVADIKASQLAKVSRALGIPVWKSMARAEFTDEMPSDPTVEAQRIASIIEDEPDLKLTMGNLIGLGPRDQRAVRKYVEMLKQSDQNDPQSPPESES